ncbi:DUF4265 domain-containing protein [Mucilaginibacter mali]|uniref:DUF4265 domain-containing protein n=1 Tax=Mucilaginibacter mali TaxID=2740462 RepID=A0A7D4UKB3_9SPHI|nr:DUF4265 domain-containing protein [Mucilaginibacter mali]QKJ30362.1 DUF4265 domain-containing protein [Mucilaginibacter mali]
MRNKITITYRDLKGEIAEETIWAELVNNEYYKIDNIPFFAPNLAYNDIISVEEDDGVLYFNTLIKSSMHTTIQIIFFDRHKESEVLKKIEEMGCAWEGMQGGAYYAVDVPPNINYNSIKVFLDEQQQNLVLDYKEACLGNVSK